MAKIFKYELVFIDNKCTLELPLFSIILSIQYQGTKICLWAIVPMGLRVSNRNFTIYGTGDEVENKIFHFNSTIQNPITQKVCHIFEV